jgi:cytochrome o ubiquinol oxidase operon protein cyoD
MNAPHSGRAENLSDEQREERKLFRAYVWGFGLALALTVGAFGLVQWAALPRFWMVLVIGVLALLQMLVHFRFFLHLGLRQKREDLQLIVFSALLLIIMVAGTIWIMTSLAGRMGMPA